jgi:hypothetical protein
MGKRDRLVVAMKATSEHERLYHKCFYELVNLQAEKAAATKASEKQRIKEEIHHVELCMQFLNSRKVRGVYGYQSV